jgi:hypothetical protein
MRVQSDQAIFLSLMPADPLGRASFVCAAQSIGSIQLRWSPWPGLGQCGICCCESLHIRKKHVSQPVGVELAFENIQMQLLHVCGSSDLKIAL